VIPDKWLAAPEKERATSLPQTACHAHPLADWLPTLCCHTIPSSMRVFAISDDKVVYTFRIR
jgi:hypothetical protein